MYGPTPLHIGIDLDNTIVCYDQVFTQEVSRLHESLPSPARKFTIREYFLRQPDGEKFWTRLQGAVYGQGMKQATLYDGVKPFLFRCSQENIRVSIISHRTRYPVDGPRVDLHQAARDWLDEHAIHVPFFVEKTRRQKIEKIATLDCTHMIDDLPEIFLDTQFPGSTTAILYGQECTTDEKTREYAIICPTWEAIGTYFFGASYVAATNY